MNVYVPEEMVRTRILLIALLAFAVLAGPAAAAQRLVPQGWLGVTADGPFDPGDAGEWDRMARAGVETVRTGFRWYQLEPAPGRLDLARSDGIVAAAARRGIGVLPVIENVPGWAATRPGDLAAPPRDPATLRAFAAALVDRYGPRGSFWRDNPQLERRPIRAWQVLQRAQRPRLLVRAAADAGLRRRAAGRGGGHPRRRPRRHGRARRAHERELDGAGSSSMPPARTGCSTPSPSTRTRAGPPTC